MPDILIITSRVSGKVIELVLCFHPSMCLSVYEHFHEAGETWPSLMVKVLGQGQEVSIIFYLRDRCRTLA